MKLKTKEWIVNFKDLLSKVTSFDSENHKNNQKNFSSSHSSLSSSYTVGYTKGFADFLPNEHYQWFVSRQA